MQAIDLYNRLERDFKLKDLWDEWAKYMVEVQDYLCANFVERSMGLVCDFAGEINKVYTAVFPNDGIMQRILDDGTADAMLFVHHPCIWDIRRVDTFYQMNHALLEKFRENRIAIYNLHVPLDNYSEYSTGRTLADALGMEVEKPFAAYRGGLAGVIGKTKCKDADELNDALSKAVGHATRLYLYGDKVIKDGRIAVVAGGGNSRDTVDEMLDNHVNVLITGIAAKNDHSAGVHDLERENRINVLGGTHYSTEKFACQKMCAYFEGLGLASEFLEGEPVLEDM